MPASDDIAVIGTRFRQARTPGWYYNMRAEPRVEIAYRDKTIRAIAREANETERQAIWDRGSAIYAVFAGRVTNREIYVMILSAEAPT